MEPQNNYPQQYNQPQQNQQAYNQYDQQQYQQAYNQQYSQSYQQYGPARQLNTHRGLLKFILLGIITFGIYPLVFFSGISEDINLVASRFDGKKTMHFCLLFFLVGPITFGIADIVWFHRISSRLGNELTRRGIPYSFGAVDYWLWNVLGSLIIIGPLVYIHKIAKASVLIAQDYNARG
ncbi:MAG: DUF4234 domain-containing protein [Ruminiclostridium sp.]|nr:DUF4234 domain-containing protein [Ruminiclostridium sp.]